MAQVNIKPRHRYFNLKQAAAYLDIDVRVLRRWVLNGLVPFEELPQALGCGVQRLRRFRQEDLDNFLDERRGIEEQFEHKDCVQKQYKHLAFEPRS